MNFINYYEVLGVSYDADFERIKKAYRTLAKKYHPDNHDGVANQESFSLINDAYHTLSDKNRRFQYDKLYREYYESLDEREDSSFFQQIHSDYQDILKEEEKMPFQKRHRIWSKRYRDLNLFERKGFTYSLGNGVLHVTGEFLFQLKKLKKYDTPSRYVLRNRRMVGVGLLSLSLMVTGGVVLGKSDVVEEEPLESPDVQRKSMKLIEMYPVSIGDTLSQISLETGISEHLIMRENHYKNSWVYADTDIKIPYEVYCEELDSYTKKVSVSDQSLEEMAVIYHTDVDTLVRLNEKSIIETDSSYVVRGEWLRVPVFHKNNVKVKS